MKRNNLHRKRLFDWWLSGGDTPDPYPTVDISDITDYIGFGDSFTEGVDATVPTTGGYAYLIGTTIAETLTNYAVGGRGVWEAAKEAGENLTNDNDALVIVMAGLNDMRRSGSNQKTFNKILGTHRAIAALKFRSSIVAAGSASVTRGGSHLVFNGQSVGCKFGDGLITIPGNTASFVNAAGSWSYTFTGTTIAVGMASADGINVITWGTSRILIDDVEVEQVNHSEWYDGISDGSYNNQRGPIAFIFGGLSSGEHTIVVERLTGIVVVDYFAVLADPLTSKPIIFSEIPYVEDYLKPGADQGSIEISDSASAYIEQVYEEFSALGYPITYVPINSSPYTSTLDNTDGVHRNDAGHVKMADAFLAQITGY